MSETWANATGESGLDLHLDLNGRGGVRNAIMRALRDAVRTGRLAPGTRLPSSRSLAADLGVARNTVAEAYAELVAEGWLTARQGAGTRVAQRAALTGPAAERKPTRAVRTAKPEYDLMPGTPDPSAFPRAAWLTSARRALTTAPSEAFGRGDPQGRLELRRALVGYLARTRGVRADPDRIVICSGCAHALGLLSRALDGTVGVESYGLYVHRDILAAHGVRTVPLRLDDHGAEIEELASTDATAVLLTPAHQFPTGGPLHPERRAAVIDWARATSGLVLEDDYDGEFRYDRQPVGAVQGLDPDRVVYLGTTSKSLSPALRLGWMVLPENLVDGVLAMKGGQEWWASALDQLVLADFIDSGSYDRHVRRMRLRYRRRRDQLVTRLGEHAPRVRVTGIAAGLHAVLELPPGTEQAVVQAGMSRGIALEGLSPYRHPDSTMAPLDGLVVSYGTPPDHAFAGALEALCQTLAAES
ncbi:GntR family transcriptional regulator [Longimycelium tulufanense]|uniref:GntR family transcriptional regulator n=1 Tax=Longimycelium tulufanense TaxID=907463 RepID=A0A8J3C775_9PSEU|nr:PLP-dependent aminotransferase family protein [Longimycelium tulufanense]GGM33377.1 GntR family transcriptional regulator [Longimycelium tulufanense]